MAPEPAERGDDAVLHLTYRYTTLRPSRHRVFGQCWLPRAAAAVHVDGDEGGRCGGAGAGTPWKASDGGDLGRELDADADELRELVGRGAPRVRGMVLLVHGLHGNSSFEFLDADAPGGVRRRYAGSLVEQLNRAGFVVFAHDHMGHGRTRTAKGRREARVVDSFATLELDVVAHVELMRRALFGADAGADGAPPPLPPTFLIGTSMGGLTALQAARHHRERLFPRGGGGVVLVAPALQPPSDMFGLKGRILYRLSAAISAWFPRYDAIMLPKCELFPRLQQEYDRDEWNTVGKLKARLGREIIVNQEDVERRIQDVDVPLLALYGTEDTLTDPKAVEQMVQRARSTDKEVVLLAGMWHMLLHEPKGGEARQRILLWIQARSAPVAPAQAAAAAHE